MHPLTRRAITVALFGFHLPLLIQAQRPPAQPNAAEILHRMQKLNVLGSVLYIVAHPDDENTRLITWLANGKKVRTADLSLTRGDGGQNLIGPELGDALGIIRTQELLEARRIDGGEQFFTRAVDFGYSKSAEESFAKWGKQEVLSDVVRVIRTFRPDIIITRFNVDGSGGHGHHTASALIAAEAFDLAGDPKAFPEQLQQGLEVWQPRRLFYNGSSWWRKDLAELAKTDPSWYTVDVGGYDPLLGLSYTEIAGRSRSMHKSQGFGAAETRGEMLEYLHLEKGDQPKTKDIFEGIDLTWKRNAEMAGSQPLLARIIEDYDPQHPEHSIDALLALRDSLVPLLYDELNALVQECLGFVVEGNGVAPMRAVGDSIVWDISATNRSPRNGRMLSILEQEHGWSFPTDRPLKQDVSVSQRVAYAVKEEPVDEPFWLRDHRGKRDYLYHVSAEQIGSAAFPPRLQLDARIQLGTSDFYLPLRTQFKWVDRVAGERIRPVYVTPVASVIPKPGVLIARGGPQQVIVEVEALTDGLEGQLNVTLPEGWATTKDLKLVNIAKRNGRQSFTFDLLPLENAAAGMVKFDFVGPKGKADRTLHEIDYPHIMPQVYYTPAEVHLVPLDVKTTARTVGYIKGAGDDVPQAIEQLGVEVEMIDAGTATLESLRKYDAIVTGIRAYNTTKELKDLNPVLMEYTKEGGTLVVQYNTLSRDMVLPDSLFGPYPFKLTRDRVTVEEASPTFLQRDHPLLNVPNKITSADFDDWVQERGLYFCGSLDAHYTPLIAWNDPGEQPLNGGLITCDYGKGRYIYTGISFFRELPAGVPGAYRLFANLISGRGQMKNEE